MDEMLSQMGQLVSVIARNLVDRPQEVYVRGLEGANTMVLELHVAKEDVGQVIGRDGRTAQAIRTLVRAVSAKLRKRTVLEIIDQQHKIDLGLCN
jgi:predicted RNA-binding protein YlqC (UPF0109 family)